VILATIRVDCIGREYDSCRICKENSIAIEHPKIIDGQSVRAFICEPMPGYYITSEYSAGVKHGASSNKPLVQSQDIILSNNNGGITPEYERAEPFQKCDYSCIYCKGPGKDECTACWAGKRLNVSKNFNKEKDVFPFGVCDNECEVSKY
jgi:hypothetical protein